MNSIIKKLKNEGVLGLHLDFRQGHYDDLSGNGNVVTVGNTPLQTGFVQQNSGSTDYLSIADSASIKGTTQTILFYGEFNDQTASTRMASKSGQFTIGVSAAGLIYFNDVTNTRTVAGTIAGKRCFAVSYASGGTPIGYLDGISIGNFSGTATTPQSANALTLCSSSPSLQARHKAFMIFTRVLTATEIAQVYAELCATENAPVYRMSSAVSSQETATKTAVPVASWKAIVGDTLVDSMGTANGTIGKGVGHEMGPMMSSLRFDGDTSNVTVGNVAALKLDTKTIEFWAKTVATAATSSIAYSTNSTLNFYISFRAANLFRVGFLDSSAATVTVSTATNAFQTGVWTHFAATQSVSGSTVITNLYINGALAKTQTDTTGYQSAFTADIRIGALAAGSLAFSGNIAGMNVYSSVLSASAINSIYEQGRKAIESITDGKQVGYASQGGTVGAFLDKTELQFSEATGRWQTTTDTINGNKVLVAKCTTSGTAYITSESFRQSAAESAFGKWEFWLNHDGAAGDYIQFVSDRANAPIITPLGYQMVITNAETLLLRTVAAGSSTTLMSRNTAVTAGAWTKYTITRSPIGVFTLYVNDVPFVPTTGANPATSLTYTSGGYFVLDLDAGSMVSLGSPDGKYGITKTVV